MPYEDGLLKSVATAMLPTAKSSSRRYRNQEANMRMGIGGESLNLGDDRLPSPKTTGVLELNPPLFKNPEFFPPPRIEKNKNPDRFRGKFGKNKNPRAQRANFFGVFKKCQIY